MQIGDGGGGGGQCAHWGQIGLMICSWLDNSIDRTVKQTNPSYISFYWTIAQKGLGIVINESPD